MFDFHVFANDVLLEGEFGGDGGDPFGHLEVVVVELIDVHLFVVQYEVVVFGEEGQVFGYPVEVVLEDVVCVSGEVLGGGMVVMKLKKDVEVTDR
jgi:hypothetical protein